MVLLLSEFLVLDLPVLVAGVVCGVCVLLSSVSVDGYLCFLIGHHYHCHCNRSHRSRAYQHQPSSDRGAVEKGLQLGELGAAGKEQV